MTNIAGIFQSSVVQLGCSATVVGARARVLDGDL